MWIAENVLIIFKWWQVKDIARITVASIVQKSSLPDRVEISDYVHIDNLPDGKAGEMYRCKVEYDPRDFDVTLRIIEAVKVFDPEEQPKLREALEKAEACLTEVAKYYDLELQVVGENLINGSETYDSIIDEADGTQVLRDIRAVLGKEVEGS